MTAERVLTPIDRAFLTYYEDATELILVRHGQQVFPDPATGKVGDWVDPPLSDIGNRQVAAVGRYLAPKRVDAVYSSQLVRANETALAIARPHDLEVVVEEDLREIETFRDLPRDVTPMEAVGELRLKGARERFVRHRTWDVYPYTERNEEFRHRTVNAIEGILATHPGQRVVVACHGGVINAYLGEVLGLLTAMFFRPAHASVHRVRAHDDTRALGSLNEIIHLDGEDPDLVTF
ncbi:MAG: histidine phosphatase family protein [Acidimicrobiia bacterium]|nr:histidine phosphatase family protein [Acidimicrobiia bacterium]